ncbi:ERBB receptor feedback inhibitor 1 isoform X2 [Anolis sagrei]
MSATLEGAFLPSPTSLQAPRCGGRRRRSPFFGVDPGSPSVERGLTENGGPRPCGGRSPGEEDVPAWPLSALGPRSEGPEDSLAALLLGFGRLSASGGAERSARPLPPLPPAEDDHNAEEEEEADREVEFLTSSDTQRLLGGAPPALLRPTSQGQQQQQWRGFRDCGQVNHAYFEAAKEEEEEAAKAPPPLHRRLRRSHSGPAGSFHKPTVAVRASGPFRRASPASDDDEGDSRPVVPPRVPIPARALKPDRRRWSAEVASGAYSDEDRPPKVPPREPLLPPPPSALPPPLRTPSPKSLPCYLHGVMPPTQSFAPDPKYVSSKALLLQRQRSEGASPRGGLAPCILPIMENGRKASSTHYYLLPERPPYLDRYERFFQDARAAEEADAIAAGRGGPSEAGFGDPAKRRHFPCVVAP